MLLQISLAMRNYSPALGVAMPMVYRFRERLATCAGSPSSLATKRHHPPPKGPV